ncbi:MAG: prepilin peptidase [Aquabacterium sp.]
MAAGTAAALGLIVGSFLNVVIHRLPRMLQREWHEQCAELTGATAPPAPRFDLLHPRSHCPACKTPVAPWHNVPLLGYAWLRGRCAACSAAIPIRYPLVECAGGVLAAAAVWRFGFNATGLSAAVLAWALLALAMIDLDTQLLPDDITLPFVWLGLLVNLYALHASLTAAVVGAMTGYLVLWLVYHAFRLATGKEGMGYGDFKLLAMLGAWLGWQQLPVIVVLSSFVGAVVGIGLIVFRRHDRSVPIPFGPYLAAAGWIALMWGDSILAGYLGRV